MLAHVVVVALSRDLLDDQPEHDVARVRVALRRARLEEERLVHEHRQEVGERPKFRLRRRVVALAEEVAEARRHRQELLDGDLVGDGRRVVGQALADRVRQRELALLGELGDRDLCEDLVDRAEVELRVRAVGGGEVAVGHPVRLVEERLSVLGDQDDAGKGTLAMVGGQKRVRRCGDLGVRALARLGGGARPLRVLELQAQDPEVGRRFEHHPDLDPVLCLLAAGEKLDLGRLRRQHLMEGDRSDFLRHPAEALDALLERDLLLGGRGEVARDEGPDGVGRTGLEGRDERRDPAALRRVGRGSRGLGPRGAGKQEKQGQGGRERSLRAVHHALVYARAAPRFRFFPRP